MATNRPIPVEATHPGSILKEELKERGISHDKFAETIGVAEFMVSETINEKIGLISSLYIHPKLSRYA